MKKLALLLTFCFATSLIGLNAQNINTDKSVVKFHITGGGIFKVKGTFTGMTGDFNLIPNDLGSSSFNVCIDAKTINTKNDKRDAHLRNPDFFEVDKHPTICFVSNNVSATDGGFTTSGNLTIHGVTKEVTIPFTFKNNTFTGDIVVNRFDYDLGKDYGTMRVGTEAKISITCVVDN